MYNLWFKQAHWKDNLEVVDEVSDGYKESVVDSGVTEGLKSVTDLWTDLQKSLYILIKVPWLALFQPYELGF